MNSRSGLFLSSIDKSWMMICLFFIFLSIWRSSARFNKRWKATKRTFSCFLIITANFFSSFLIIAAISSYWGLPAAAWTNIKSISQEILTIFHFLLEFFDSDHISLDLMFYYPNRSISNLILLRKSYMDIALQSAKTSGTAWNLSKLGKCSAGIESVLETSWNRLLGFLRQYQRVSHDRACTPYSHWKNRDIAMTSLLRPFDQSILHRRTQCIYLDALLKPWKNQGRVPWLSNRYSIS